MSKILISFYQSIIDTKNPGGIICFYESFAKELSSYGNEVLCVNLKNFKDYYSDKFTELSLVQKDNFISKLKKFNPDIIFAFNNQISREIIKNTSCPICLTDADGINLFANKEFITEYNERYYLCSFYKGWENESYSLLGFNNDKIIYLSMATSIKNEKLEKTNNISFIGTKFGEFPVQLLSKLENCKELSKDLIKYYENQYKNYDYIVQKYTEKFECDVVSLYPMLDMRLYILQSILDLGLKLYGVRWNTLPKEMLNLRLAYDETPKYTLEDNQNVYNSSKINISISHPQCKGYAFPWRIYDIMASSGLLVASYSKLLEEKTKGIVDIPMFKSPYEARDLCKYALNNPSYCEDIIRASNEYIEKYGRWKNNFEILSDKFDIKLLNDKKENEEFQVYNDITVKLSKRKNIIKRRIKIFCYSILLAFSQIPILNIFQNENKLHQKVEKYWRI